MKLQKILRFCLASSFVFSLMVGNVSVVFAQDEEVQQATVLHTDSKPTAETFRAVFVKPANNNGTFVGLGTNTGIVRFGEINSTVTKLLPKRIMPQDRISDSSVREIIFLTNNKSYLLKTDGLYQAVDDMTEWEQILSVDDLMEVKGATPELRTMFLVSPSRMCLAGNYVKNNTDGVIERELLFCNDDIKNRDKWRPESGPETRKIAKLQITKLHFSDDGKSGWAVGTKGSIWFSEDKGQSWTEQTSGTEQPLLSVFGLNESTAWAVGYGGTILELKPVKPVSTQQPAKPKTQPAVNKPNKNQPTVSKPDKSQPTSKQKYKVDQIVKIKKGRVRQAIESKFNKNVELLGKITAIDGKKLTVELQKINGKPALSFVEKLFGIFETGDFDLSNIELDESEVEPLETEKTSNTTTVGNNEVVLNDPTQPEITKDDPQMSLATWVKKPLPAAVTNKTVILRNVKFSDFDDNVGWIVGDAGTILYTVDAGKTWKRLAFSQTDQVSMKGVDFYSMFVDERYCWVVGSKGTVVRIKYQ